MSFHLVPRLKLDRYEVNIIHPAKVPLQVLSDRFEGGTVALQSGDAPDSVRYRFVGSIDKALPREGNELDIDDWAPSILMSTFPDYATLAAAYQSRAAPRAQPDGDIRELALKVTQGAESDRERVARIRDWVNRNIRYLSVHIGVEDWINGIHQRYDEGGTGRMWAGDPLKQGEPWEVNAEFELESVVTLPGPSAMRIPVGITRADIRGIANWRPLANRRNPFECSAGRWRDDIDIELPIAAKIAYIPSGVSAESGACRYRSEWKLEENRLRVVRELSIQRDRSYCVPQDERDFIPVREAMRRDLMGQVMFGVMP